MNVTETNAEGLARELKVVVGADELEKRLSTRLDELKDKAQIKGFRPGHVPKAHLRKIYGRSVMSDVLQQAVADTSREALSEREERPAFQPKVSLPEDEAEIEKIFDGTADLAYTLSFEVLPAVEVMDLSTLTLERPVTVITEKDIDEAVDRILATNQNYKLKKGAAKKGDRVVIDFVGKIDGKAFEGGTADDAPIVLGAGGFIPGFEEGLTGAKEGDERNIEGVFPEVEHRRLEACPATELDMLYPGLGASLQRWHDVLQAGLAAKRTLQPIPEWGEHNPDFLGCVGEDHFVVSLILVTFLSG